MTCWMSVRILYMGNLNEFPNCQILDALPAVVLFIPSLCLSLHATVKEMGGLGNSSYCNF